MKVRQLSSAIVLLLSVALILASERPASAEEGSEEAEDRLVMQEVVVTATRTEVPLEETTKSIEVVTKADVEEQQQYFLPELMGNLPGVLLRRNGGMGQWSNISIRGAGPQYTQYQYNGLPLRDIGDTQGALTYHVGDLIGASNLDRVEVLKGTNSTLYGSDAMGGVINIIPQKWQGGLKGEVRAEVGPDSTFSGNARIAYGRENFYIDINPLYATTDGMKNDGDGDFYYDNIGFAFGSGFKPSDTTALEFSALYYDSELGMGSSPHIDANGNLITQQADADQHREGLLYQLGLIWTHQLMPRWDYTIKGSHSGTERHYFTYDREDAHSDYDGKNDYVEMQHNLHLADWLTFSLGGNYEKQNYIGKEPNNPGAGDYSTVKFDEERKIWDAFTQAQFVFLDRSLFLTLGGRYHDPEGFDEETVWEASAAYIFEATQTKVHAHVGTGYRAPSLYELYGGYVYSGNAITIGDPDLVPEESLGWEVGIDQAFMAGRMSAGVTYFKTEFEHLINFDSATFTYGNVDDAETSGVESYVSIRPWRMLKLDLAYTYTHLEGRTNYPRHKFDLVATVYPIENLTVVCDVSYQDDKTVTISNVDYTKSIDYNEDHPAIVSLALTNAVSEHMDLFVRAENLLDEDYTEGGYLMPGLSVYGGVKLSY